MKFRKAKVAPDQMGLGFSVAEMTRVPSSDWTPPDLSALPDRLEGATIGVDTETCDRGLQAGHGAGWAWLGGGRVVGYSVSADNCRVYLPVAHEGGGNVDADQARRWLNHVLGDETQTKVFAHAQYDLGWSRRDGVTVKGPVVDVQWVEALIDEYRRTYSLDDLARDRLGVQKDESLLRDAAKAHGFHPKNELWRLHSKYVGPYAEVDAELPRKLWEIQRHVLEAEGLMAVHALEHSLIPLYLDMRWRGVRIDQDYAEQLRTRFKGEGATMLEEIRRRTGQAVEPWAAKSVAKVLDAEGIKYAATANGGPSITKGFLERTDHWFTKAILRVRELDKLVGTFLEGQLIDQLHNGRVHGEIHPLKSDDGGTVTGRLSMSNPNLQFIPTRTEESKLIRRCLLPERGELWASPDFSQQEPRLLVHYAYLAGMPGAREARERYHDDPSMSYHKFTAELMSIDDYKLAKILNLAIIYGRGVGETAVQLGRSTDDTKRMFADHEREMPFAKALARKCQSLVQQRGYIVSLTGRRMRFPVWEPRDWDARTGEMLPLEKARERWPGQELVRARIHKALNSLIQPAAADQTKLAMRAVMDAGYGSRVLVQVHDELGCSVPDEKTGRDIAEIMEGAVRLEVPTKVDLAVGPSWKDAD
jgi:DNA polymerase I-like protein with 3'-5' exonuclease and polymerase domains